MEELSKEEIELVSGGNTPTGAGWTLGATLVGIAAGVATGGLIGVLVIGGAAVGGLAYAYDFYHDNA
ncbi:hypothetical protein D0T25_28005 [Duganella sp. BJB488]|uniref:hypothetical protein n=1 Tax=unclassified Duganella TaxID=2636909 RepID=UPI000E3575DA|nr:MULTISPECIES: hypothetical protein [unclassified Duganella]RFP10450.1 hypothetical protein D0T26_27015 [Duganella sp. BJB489]RFP14290.1 hypothetical protein D0T25_28005 [Duganella sp. BJB488]RFP30227.1 hypothetical protein D0T24_28705 [Duganella sp. BJB480]